MRFCTWHMSDCEVRTKLGGAIRARVSILPFHCKNMRASRWRTPLFSCCSDPATCCYVTWCMPCAYADLVALQPPRGSMPGAGNWDAACCTLCLLQLVSGAYGSGRDSAALAGARVAAEAGEGALQSQLRRLIRARFGIKENRSDCCVGTCCGPCALCQEHREFELRRVAFGSPGPASCAPSAQVTTL